MTLLNLKTSRVRSERKIAAPSERTFTGTRVVNTDRLYIVLFVGLREFLLPSGYLAKIQRKEDVKELGGEDRRADSRL